LEQGHKSAQLLKELIYKSIDTAPMQYFLQGVATYNDYQIEADVIDQEAERYEG